MRPWAPAVFALAVGCGDALPEECADREPPLSWSNFGEAHFRAECTGCHHSSLEESSRSGAPVGADFDTYAGVAALADDIAARAVEEDADMPPAAPSEEGARELLGEWLDCGLPE
jgi:uncharacterized membrane protein